jgi:hypothetical protein
VTGGKPSAATVWVILQYRARIRTVTCGNLKFDVDFRSVYQTLIRDWLQGDAATVLGATYPELPFINKA